MSIQKAATILNVLNQVAQAKSINEDPIGFVENTLRQQGFSDDERAKAGDMLDTLVGILQSP